jgi:putative membrane protein
MPFMENSGERDPRVYFAAERTFLAWIRTGLGLMGVGFAVARFGLFLREMESGPGKLAIHSTGISAVSGVALVVLGVVVNVSATWRHVQTTRELSSGTWVPGRVSRDAVVLALLLAAVGAAMAAYLLVVR